MQKISRKYREASKGIWRKNPILMPLAIISVVGRAESIGHRRREFVVLWPDPCHFHIGDVGEDEGTTNNRDDC
jgi:hypothetical protein